MTNCHKEYKSFVEWNKDPKVAQAASDLYGGDIERLELYPGLHAEGTSGDGLQNYDSEPLRVSTMRNGLLFDAIALVRFVVAYFVHSISCYNKSYDLKYRFAAIAFSPPHSMVRPRVDCYYYYLFISSTIPLNL
jgi:hypothetical protein